jgi:hypothetical protein
MHAPLPPARQQRLLFDELAAGDDAIGMVELLNTSCGEGVPNGLCGQVHAFNPVVPRIRLCSESGGTRMTLACSLLGSNTHREICTAK